MSEWVINEDPGGGGGLGPGGGTGTGGGGTGTGGTGTGGTGTGTGTTGTTGGVAAVAAAAVSPAQKFGGGGSGTGTFPVVVGDDGGSGYGVKSGPPLDVPNGCVVEVYPYEANTAPVYVAKGPDEAVTGPRSVHATTAPVMTYTVANLSELWVYAKKGEGVTLRIQRRV